MGDYDWRLAETNVWKVERVLLDYPHHELDDVRSAVRESRSARCQGTVPATIEGSDRWTTGRYRWNPYSSSSTERRVSSGLGSWLMVRSS